MPAAWPRRFWWFPVYAEIDDAGQVSSYVSAVRNEGVIQDVLPFSLTLEDLMRIIGWDTPPAHARRV